MAEPHVVTALVRKRAEIARRIEHTRTALRQLIIDLDNLDATLRLFVPDIDLEEIKPKPFPPRNAAVRSELSRIMLSALRQSRKPLTTDDIAQHVMAVRGLNTADKRFMRRIGKRVGTCLQHPRDKAVVRSEQGLGRFMVWKLVRYAAARSQNLSRASIVF